MTTIATCQPTGCTIWDGAPDDLATLCCLPIVEVFADLRTLNTDLGYFPSRVSLRGHTYAGDGGGGEFNFVTGQPPGYFVDDNGIVAVFDGGDGSAAMVRDIDDGVLYSSYWGMPQDGGDASDAIDAMISYNKARSRCLMDDCAEEPSFGVVIQPYKCVINGPMHGISRPINLYPGLEIEWANGSFSQALTQNMRMVQSQDPIDTAADYNTYGARNIKVTRPQLDGRGIANKGILFETVAVGSVVYDVLVYNCTGTGWADTTVSGDGYVLDVPDTTGMQALDLVEIGDDGRALLITSVLSSSQIQLNISSPVLSNATLKHRAVGIHGAMLQQTDFTGGSIRYNDVGLYLGDNRLTDGGKTFASTDDRFFGITMERNKQNCVIVDGNGLVFVGTTFQFSEGYSDLTVIGSRSLVFTQCWFECASIESIPNMTDVPVISIESSAYGLLFEGLRWVHNQNVAGWRRMMKCDGEITVNNVACNRDALAENPNIPGDYSWIELGPSGFMTQENDAGQTSIDAPYGFVTDSNGDQARNAVVAKKIWGANTISGLTRHWNADDEKVIDIVVGDEEFPRMYIRPQGIWIGDGTFEPVSVVRAPAPDWYRPTGSGFRDTWDSGPGSDVDLDKLKKIVKAIQEDLWLYGIFAESYSGNAP